MSLCGTMSGQTEIKYCNGDAFYQLLRYKPNDLSNVIPYIVQSCSLHQGKWGTEGSIIVWNFVHEGETEVQKELVEAVDEEKRSVTFKVIEGFILEMYKSFKGTFQVDTKGVKTEVTWTLEYEKLNQDVSDPQTFFDLHFKVTTDIDDYYKSVQK